MNDRENDLVKARPQISSKLLSENMSKDERFQNTTLRPVIKLQSPLLIAVFRNYIQKHKNVFHGLSTEKRLLYIENAIQKDMKFRNSVKGMIIGQFTLEEYDLYIENSSSLNKRMMNIITERLKDHVLLFEKNEVLSAVV
ncbi:glyoxalase [Kordia sp. YSTF-M3]|uniref:Glyoxalase n=1 Tax=Kordia aestuariivivens TaxID=2759037 RepID=A0ABR7Q8V0_9FLAO|nr:glyoxalase [Kordia aestuariivivens]MBC8754968.1 glyoxalase [Kordia aestuariivivens]